jgi:hypothetical protein
LEGFQGLLCRDFVLQAIAKGIEIRFSQLTY